MTSGSIADVALRAAATECDALKGENAKLKNILWNMGNEFTALLYCDNNTCSICKAVLKRLRDKVRGLTEASERAEHE